MSNDTSNTPRSGDLFSGGAAHVRAYRFEFRHALALPAALILFIAVAGAMLSFARFGVEIFGPEPRIVRAELDGAELLKGQGADVDCLPAEVSEILDVWAYWLADSEFSPASECLFITLDLE